MKKITRVLLLSTAIAFPVKVSFSAPKDSSEARRKKTEFERVEKILSNLQDQQGISDPPFDSDPKTLIKASAPTTEETSVQHPAEEESRQSSAPETTPFLPSTLTLPAVSLTLDGSDVSSPTPFQPSDLSGMIFQDVEPMEMAESQIPIQSPINAPDLSLVPSGVSMALAFPEITETPSEAVPVPVTDVTSKENQAESSPVEVSRPSPKKILVRLTFYSGKDDQWGSRVAWQKVARAKKGRTAAADPAIFPYGTWVHIPGFGKLRVEDTGTAVKSRKASGGTHPVIDIYVGDEKEALRLASSTPDYVEITIL